MARILLLYSGHLLKVGMLGCPSIYNHPYVLLCTPHSIFATQLLSCWMELASWRLERVIESPGTLILSAICRGCLCRSRVFRLHSDIYESTTDSFSCCWYIWHVCNLCGTQNKVFTIHIHLQALGPGDHAVHFCSTIISSAKSTSLQYS